MICLKQPVGDYYQYRNEILCASCFDFNWQWQEKFKRTYVEFKISNHILFFYIGIFKRFKKFVTVHIYMNILVLPLESR